MQTYSPIGETKLACLITWLSCMDLKGSPYTKVSIDKTRDLLAKKHRKKIERRWCIQCTTDLVKAGLITRRPRYVHRSDGTIRQVSSMIAFTLAGAKYLISKGVERAIVIKKQILAWMKNEDKRFPVDRDLTVSVKEEIDPGEARRLAFLASKVHKPWPD